MLAPVRKTCTSTPFLFLRTIAFGDAAAAAAEEEEVEEEDEERLKQNIAAIMKTPTITHAIEPPRRRGGGCCGSSDPIFAITRKCEWTFLARLALAVLGVGALAGESTWSAVLAACVIHRGVPRVCV
jgi:hypothetical protein